MKNKIVSVFIIFSLLPFIILTSGFSKNSVTIINSDGEALMSFYSQGDITASLKRAFEYTKNNAYENNRLLILLENGRYDVKETIYISSYTTLDLNGARLVNANKERGNIFKSPDDKDYSKYSSLVDFTMKNGTLDGNFNANRSCMLRLCHSENIVIDSVAFFNNYYSHHAELAACKNVTFNNCTFFGQISDLNISSSEAIQIDILDETHFYGFTCYDNTMNDTVVVKNCRFKNVYRGIGTHNYFKNLYHKNITITNCTFENITDCAVSSVNFKNILFKDNKYVNCKYSVFSRDNGK